ncbi:unnamed protein product [Rotaria sp. Silwood2]|nr:unnamed protein product [Rotaria sp. Silwood2]
MSCYYSSSYTSLIVSQKSGPNASSANKAGLDDDTSDCCITDAESIRCLLLVNEPVKDEQTGFNIDDDNGGDADIKRISSISYQNIILSHRHSVNKQKKTFQL